MCSRFGLQSPLARLQELFGFEGGPAVAPRYNVAPSQPVLAVLDEGPRRAARLVRWGMEHPASSARLPFAPLINARSEALTEKAALRDALRERRCVVPADGFYEWRQEGALKQPYWFSPASGRPFAFAALHDPARQSCTLLTCAANARVRPIHDRMPVIVPQEALACWLDPSAPEDELLRLLRPLPADELAVRRVSTLVNDVRREGPELLQPPAQGLLF